MRVWDLKQLIRTDDDDEDDLEDAAVVSVKQLKVAAATKAVAPATSAA